MFLTISFLLFGARKTASVFGDLFLDCANQSLISCTTDAASTRSNASGRGWYPYGGRSTPWFGSWRKTSPTSSPMALTPTPSEGYESSSGLSRAQYCVSVALTPQMIFVLGANANWGRKWSWGCIDESCSMCLPFWLEKVAVFWCKDFIGWWSNCG